MDNCGVGRKPDEIKKRVPQMVLRHSGFLHFGDDGEDHGAALGFLVDEV